MLGSDVVGFVRVFCMGLLRACRVSGFFIVGADVGIFLLTSPSGGGGYLSFE